MDPAQTPASALERLATELGLGPPAPVVELEGGASTRRFFRVPLSDGQTGVGMYVPDASKPDEISKGTQPGRWPFLEVRDLLEQRGVRVPRLLGEACSDGVIIVEDLGDDTLARYLEHHPETKEQLYQTAIRDLARAQQVLGELPTGSVIGQRAFDAELLRWEVDHFREWALEARGTHLDADDRACFDRAADYLSRTIASWPQGFVHRDYQSRNLMVREVNSEPELTWIDFQDALLGPRVYDLAALLNDSYQTFEPGFVARRLDEYAELRGFDESERERVGREFDMVTVQRKLKDAGRFVFVERVRKNPGFLQFVEPTIAKVRSSLERLVDVPELLELQRLLDRVL